MAQPQKKASLRVLVYSPIKRSQDTIRRHYYRWREEHGMPIRCDIPSCQFHTKPLIWNGQPFRPILDHIDGNRFDNRPNKLRLLCPNCDALLDTRGGANRGKVVDVSAGGFGMRSRNKGVNYVLPVEAAEIVVDGGHFREPH